MNRRAILATLVVVGGLTAGLLGTRPVAAQGPAGTGIVGVRNFLVCSTTDYTEVAAKALGITAANLRVALVSGKTLQEVATSKNVQLQTVTDALTAARKADVDQAVKDGLLTQAQADALNTNTTRPRVTVPGLRGFGVNAGISAYHTVKPYVVAAQAIGISCGDLVKGLQQGQSIVKVAEGKNVQAQKVIDALTKAYKDALAQDVKEGLRTQAEADGRSVHLTETILQMISRPAPGLRRGIQRNGNPGGGGFPGRRNRPSATATAAPTAEATAAATGVQ